MATQWQTFPIEFRGGLISNLSALQQGTNAVGSATILQNMEPNKEGGYTKIRGFEKYSTTTVPGSGPILESLVLVLYWHLKLLALVVLLQHVRMLLILLSIIMAQELHGLAWLLVLVLTGVKPDTYFIT
jgi:hypothetical protein